MPIARIGFFRCGQICTYALKWVLLRYSVSTTSRSCHLDDLIAGCAR